MDQAPEKGSVYGQNVPEGEGKKVETIRDRETNSGQSSSGEADHIHEPEHNKENPTPSRNDEESDEQPS